MTIKESLYYSPLVGVFIFYYYSHLNIVFIFLLLYLFYLYITFKIVMYLIQFILLFFSFIFILIKFLSFPVYLYLCILFFILIILILWNFYRLFFFLIKGFTILICSSFLGTNILLFSGKPKTLNTNTLEAPSTSTPETPYGNTTKKVSLSSKKYRLEKNRSNFFWVYYNKDRFKSINIRSLFGIKNKKLINKTLVLYLIWILNGRYNITGRYFVYDRSHISLSRFKFYTLISFPSSIAVYKVSKVNYKVFLTVFTEGIHILDYSWGTYFLKYYKLYNLKTVNYLQVPLKNVLRKNQDELSLSYRIENAMLSNYTYHKMNFIDSGFDLSIRKSFLVNWCNWCRIFLRKKKQRRRKIRAKYKFFYDIKLERKLSQPK